MKAPDTLERKKKKVLTWAYLLESMDLACKECPIYDICLQMEKRDSCYDVLSKALSFVNENIRVLHVLKESR